MSTDEILAWSRAVERPLIVLLCGMSVAMGYQLFKIGIAGDQKGSVAVAQWKVSLDRVGPGIFFALFGMVGLCFETAHVFEIGGSSASPSPARPAMSYAGPTTDRMRMSEVRALNRIIDPPGAGDDIDAPVLAGMVKQDKPFYLDLRRNILLTIFTPEDLQLWQERKADYRIGMVADESLLKRLARLEPYMEGSR